MVHWIWLIVVMAISGAAGACAMGLLAANQEEHRKWWDDDRGG